MHFCENCGNMYYIELNKNNADSLIYYCRNCQNKNDKLIQELNNFCVSKTHIIQNTSHGNVINEYTHLDPTLPRVKFNMDCPNPECDSNKKSSDESKSTNEAGEETKPKEIIYLRYNDSGMKYVYLCGVCKTHWKTDK